MDSGAIRELKARYRADALALGEEKYRLGYAAGLEKGKKASKDSRVRLRAAIEAIGSMRKRYKKEALKRCDEMFAEGFERGLEQGKKSNKQATYQQNDGAGAIGSKGGAKLVHLVLEQTYMLKQNFMNSRLFRTAHNLGQEWDFKYVETYYAGRTKTGAKRWQYVAIISNQEASSRHGHSEEQLQLRLDAMMQQHENDQAKIMKLQKENISYGRNSCTTKKEKEREAIHLNIGQHRRYQNYKYQVRQQSWRHVNVYISTNFYERASYFVHASTTPIRLDIREMDLPPLWLELVHAHLNATSKASIPWRVLVHKPRQMDTGTNASSPFMAYDVLSDVAGDEVHGTSNIVDGQYVPWHAKIGFRYSIWEKDNSVLRPLVHRRFKSSNGSTIALGNSLMAPSSRCSQNAIASWIQIWHGIHRIP